MRDICDGLDNNCNGIVDEFLASSRYLDADGDGYSTGASMSMCLPELSNGLRMYYSFDASNGTDDSGHGLTGTVLSGVSFATGKTGKGATFDGVDDMISHTQFAIAKT